MRLVAYLGINFGHFSHEVIQDQLQKTPPWLLVKLAALCRELKAPPPASTLLPPPPKMMIVPTQPDKQTAHRRTKSMARQNGAEAQHGVQSNKEDHGDAFSERLQVSPDEMGRAVIAFASVLGVNQSRPPDA